MTGARSDTRERKQTGGTFPGGSVTPEKGELRIAIDKKAYADVIGHAVLEPEVEVCGVLVGKLLRDAQGEFLHIRAAIRGEAAKQEGAQVTFTHDTWNHIHQEMDAHHPDEEIVGWYHTHGGFGIFLSEMDTFIHRNFFSATHQVAYVFDPLAGTEGFFQSREGQLVLCRRHWVGGRERKIVARDPASSGSSGGTASPGGDFSVVATELHRTALALQSLGQRSGEPLPLWAWIVLGVVGAAAVWMLFTGVLFPGARDAAIGRGPGHILILQRDDATGRAVGLQLHVVAPQQGVYRDEAGQLYIPAELLGPDGRPVPLATLLSQAPASPKPPAPPPVVESPTWLEKLRLPLFVALALVLAAGAAATWRTMRREPR